ncbi:MAG: molybdopterin molybdotransferase MoeA [Deferrisomatales bacterium]
MISVSEALYAIVGAVQPLPPETVSILEARGRVLAEEVCAPRDLPPRDNSAMDGYACRHRDLAAGQLLRVVGTVSAGGACGEPLGPGQAAKIMTGAPVPAGADLVVPVEDARADGEWVEVLRAPPQGAHVRPAGEDVRRGDRVLLRGTLVRPPEVAMLASLGRSFVSVHQRPRVAILSTGDELASPGDWPAEGRTFDANAYGLAAQVAEAGAVPVLLGVTRDEPRAIREALSRAESAEAVLTSGGVSAGDRDHVRGVLKAWGVESRFEKVAIKPGKPLAFGMRGPVPVFGLPGNPVAALVAFEVFVRPALLKLQGRRQLFRPGLEATLGEEAGEICGKPGRTEFLRCRVERWAHGLRVVRIEPPGSGLLSTLVRGNAFLIVPASAGTMGPGCRVSVQPYDAELAAALAPHGAGADWGQAPPADLTRPPAPL